MTIIGKIVGNLSDIHACTVSYYVDGVYKELSLNPNETVMIEHLAVICGAFLRGGDPAQISIEPFYDRGQDG